MQYRTFGDVRTSILGFGCMRFPHDAQGKVDEKATFAMLDEAYAQGVNYYDTAYPYHDQTSELILGRWLKTIDRTSVYVASKSPVWMIDDIAGFDAMLDNQLARLQVEYLDFYLLHALNKERFAKLEAMGLFAHLASLKASGKVKHIGFSFHDEYEVFAKIIQHYPWDFCQIQYNYMDTNYQAGSKGYQLARNLNIPLVIMEPIRGGMLANVPSEIQALFASYDQASPASWALRWVMAHDNVMCVLSGMSNLEQLRDNIATANSVWELDEAQHAIYAKAQALFAKRIQIACTACRYCMPCAFGVDIPRNFRIYNEGHIYQLVDHNKKEYLFMDAGKRSTACRKCSACVAKCPQHIDIPSMLEIISKAYSE
ncbi:MAG: aldo/keto reductase [Erysipelotrichaceae bacterium]|nr:aldo/keto reductase [Erysipelotrichaceae bacterium]MDY5251913.1 aldo/keto reductase [Erysipelotrichaceae bacterium]